MLDRKNLYKAHILLSNIWSLHCTGSSKNVNLNFLRLSYIFIIQNLTFFPFLYEKSILKGYSENEISQAFALCSVTKYVLFGGKRMLCVEGALKSMAWKKRKWLPHLNFPASCQHSQK